jgi:hypothetical protein
MQTIKTANHEYSAADKAGLSDYVYVARNGKYLGVKNDQRVFTTDVTSASPYNRRYFTGEFIFDFDLDSIPDEEA